MNGRTVMAVAVVAIVLVAGGAIVLLSDNDSTATTITIGYNNKVCYETFMVADALGYFDDLDVDVKVVVINGGGTDSATALLTGNVDMAAMGDTPAVRAMNSSGSTTIVCRYAYSESMHSFVARNNSGIDSSNLSTLEGKTVGVQKGSSTEGALLEWLFVNGVDADNITWSYLSPSQQVTALSNGDVDMIASSQPNPRTALKLEGAYEVGNSSGLGNSYPLILLASSSVLNEKHEAVAEVMTALQRATDYINGNTSESAGIVANLIGGSWTAGDELQCMNNMTWEIGFNSSVDVTSLNKTVDVLRNAGQQIGDIDFLERCDNRFMMSM